MSIASNVKKTVSPIAVCAAFAAVLATAGTVAYLASSDSDVNVFTLGKVGIALTETDTGIDGDNNPATNGYEMEPGAVLSKDPKVTVEAGSADCWLFVKVAETANFDDFMTYSMAEGWAQLADAEGAAVEGVFYREVPATQDAATFGVLLGDRVQVRDVSPEALRALSDETNPRLEVTAYAVQKGGVATALEAWELVGA